MTSMLNVIIVGGEGNDVGTNWRIEEGLGFIIEGGGGRRQKFTCLSKCSNVHLNKRRANMLFYKVATTSYTW